MNWSFFISYYVGSHQEEIREGAPKSAVVEHSEVNYYFFTVHSLDSDIEINVTPIQGDPDLVISLDPSERFPDTTVDWIDLVSDFNGADSLRVSPEMLIE